MTKWFLLKTDQKKVSYMHPWTETFQPYEHVKRKIYKVSRKANRNPRVGYQISNGPGPRPWTRPAPYFRRTITSYPRTSIFPRPTFNRYSPYKRQTIPKKIWELPKVMDKDFVMEKFMTSVQAFQDENQDDDSSIPSLATISDGPFSPEPSSLLAMAPTPASTPAPSPIEVRPYPHLNWESSAGTELIQAAAEAAADTAESCPLTPAPASIAASPEAAINNLNSETQKSPQAMSYINIEPIEGYEESVNENTDEQGKDEEAWNKYATDEEDDFKLKKLRLKALLTGNLLEYKKAICQVYMKQAPEPEPVPIYLQQETLLKQANQMKAEKEQKEMDSIKGDEEENGQREEQEKTAEISDLD